MSHSLFLVTLSHFFRPQAAQPSVAPHRQDSQITELIAQLLQVKRRTVEALEEDAKQSSGAFQELDTLLGHIMSSREANGNGPDERETNLKLVYEQVYRSIQRSTEEATKIRHEVQELESFCRKGYIPPIYDAYAASQQEIQKMKEPGVQVLPEGVQEEKQLNVPMPPAPQVIEIPQLPLSCLQGDQEVVPKYLEGLGSSSSSGSSSEPRPCTKAPSAKAKAKAVPIGLATAPAALVKPGNWAQAFDPVPQGPPAAVTPPVPMAVGHRMPGAGSPMLPYRPVSPQAMARRSSALSLALALGLFYGLVSTFVNPSRSGRSHHQLPQPTHPIAPYYTVMTLITMLRSGWKHTSLEEPQDKPVIVGVAADSGYGKSTFLRRILGALGTEVKPGHTAIGEMMTVICLDDYHTNDRAGRKATGLTALDARENDFDLMGVQIEALKKGVAVYKPIYNHDTGNKDWLIEPNKIMVFEGLHPIYDEKARSQLDLAIYIDIVNDVKFAWKVQRDVAERGWTEDQVREDILKRLPDFSKYVDPQRADADVILRYEPSDQGLPFLKVKLIQKKELSPAKWGQGQVSCHGGAKWHLELLAMSTDLKRKLGDPEFVATRCDLDGSGDLNPHEWKQAARVYGISAGDSGLQGLQVIRQRMGKKGFAKLVAPNPEASCT
eukprot:g30693.t1